MSLRNLFDSIVARSSEARKCYDTGMYAEALQFCSVMQEDTRLCMQLLRQAIDAQNTESQAASGESSMEGSMTMETTPPQGFTGVSPASLKRKPPAGRTQNTRKSSRPSSSPVRGQLAPLQMEPNTPPQSSYYQTDFTTPQQHPGGQLARPQTVLASQSLPHDLNLLPTQATHFNFMTPQVPHSPYGGYPNPSYPPFRSQPGTPYFTPNTLRITPYPYHALHTDFARQGQIHSANPLNIGDPRPHGTLQFRRPSEPTIPTHSEMPQTPSNAPAPPTVNLVGQVMSFPVTPPANQTSGESPFPPSLLPQLDALFLAFLQKVVSDETITDGRGEALHHPLPPRKQQKVHQLPLTSWRPFKLRIQAFTSAFQEELARTLAVNMNLARHEVSIKRVREYLWTKDLIARYNPSGRKAKSRGSHVWCVEARRRTDDPNAEWEFSHWQRKIQVVRETLVVQWGQVLRLPLKVWDPQVQYEDLEVKYSVRGQLPTWLNWESDASLVGTPPPTDMDEGYGVPITLTASYTAFGMSHVIESRLELDIRPPGSGIGDLATSLRNISGMPPSSMGPGMEGSMEAYLDDDDDDMAYANQHFSSETNTPPSGITTTMANATQLLYVPSQSLQNSPLKQTPIGHTPPPTSGVTMNPLTPSLSPASLQYNPHVLGSTPRQPASAPQTPIGGPPSHLSVQIPSQGPPGSVRFTNEPQQGQMMYSLQNHLHLNSPPASAESTGGGKMYGIDEELGSDHNAMGGHGYFDESYQVELGSPFLER